MSTAESSAGGESMGARGTEREEGLWAEESHPFWSRFGEVEHEWASGGATGAEAKRQACRPSCA